MSRIAPCLICIIITQTYMIDYYRLPAKKDKISTSQLLKIMDDSQLKDAIYNKSIEKAKLLTFKNSNIKDDSLKLLRTIASPLSIIQLDLSQNFSFITDAATEVLCELNIFPNLKVLNLADNQITDDSLVLIAKCSWMARLQQLILYGNSDVSSEGLVILAESPCVRHIKSLDLHATSVDDEGISYFLKTQACVDLQSLNLSMSWGRITNKSLYALGLSKHCGRLKRLYLEDCQVSDIGVDELSESENSLAMETLLLNNSIKQKNNLISDKALSSLAFSKYLINLTTLELRNTDITPKGLKTLSVSMAVEKIETLRLSHCGKLDEEALHYLQKITNYQSLKKLYLNDTAIKREELAVFESKNPQINLIY